MLPFPFPQIPAPRSLLDLPNELIVQVAESLNPRDLNYLLRTNHFLKELLSPGLLKRAVTAYTWPNKRSVLHWASAHDRGSLAVALLGLGAEVNTVDDKGITPLHSAAAFRNATLVMVLLDNGASAEIKDSSGWTPLVIAVISGDHVVTRLLLENGANAEIIFFERNMVYFAAALGHVAVVEVLIEMGCNTKCTSWYQIDLVQTAALSNQSEMVKWLLGVGGFCGTPLRPTKEPTDNIEPYLRWLIASMIDNMKGVLGGFWGFENGVESVPNLLT